jgi:hypothetical protein
MIADKQVESNLGLRKSRVLFTVNS